MSNWELKSFASAAAVADECAVECLALLTPSAGPKCIAISGGRIAQDFFRAVARLTKERGQSLAHVHFFWGDERCVPPDHAESNYRSASELLLTPLGVPVENIHRIRGEEEPERAARDAEAEAGSELSGELTGDSLQERFKRLETSSTSTDAQLLALKAKMGIAQLPASSTLGSEKAKQLAAPSDKGDGEKKPGLPPGDGDGDK